MGMQRGDEIDLFIDLVIALDKSEEEEFHLSRRTQYYPETYQLFYYLKSEVQVWFTTVSSTPLSL